MPRQKSSSQSIEGMLVVFMITSFVFSSTSMLSYAALLPVGSSLQKAQRSSSAAAAAASAKQQRATTTSSLSTPTSLTTSQSSSSQYSLASLNAVAARSPRFLSPASSFLLEENDDSSDNEVPSSSTSSSTVTANIETEQIVTLDGAEWKSVRRICYDQLLMLENSSQGKGTSKRIPKKKPDVSAQAKLRAAELPQDVGCMNIVIFTATKKETTEKFVGLRAPDSERKEGGDGQNILCLKTYKTEPLCLYADSVAKIPPSTSNKLSDSIIISTLVHALSHIHCVVPHDPVEAVGGDPQTLSWGNSRAGSDDTASVMVLGGNERAVAAARGLDALGLQVTLVTNDGSQPRTGNLPSTVQVLPPALERTEVENSKNDENDNVDEEDEEESELSVCEYLGKFDALLDTVGDEAADGGSPDTFTLRLLRERHQCFRYVSTVTQAQSLVEKEGLIFGRGKAQRHVDQLSSQYNNNNNNNQRWQERAFRPPRYFGVTLQALLDADCTTTVGDFATKNSKQLVRGWSLPEYWESSTWPRDAGSSTRFGLPSAIPLTEDEDDRLFELRKQMLFAKDDADDEDKEDDTPTSIESDNPFVMQLIGVKGVQQEILTKQKNCVLFLSAPFCRTCRYITPQYQRLARKETEKQKQLLGGYDDDDDDHSSAVLFARAETIGDAGKELSKRLNVESVPTFVVFKNGFRFGKPLSISRLPSKKLELVIDWIRNDQDWDPKALKELDEQ